MRRAANSLLEKPIHGLFQHAKRKVRFSLCSIFQTHTTCLENGGTSLCRTRPVFPLWGYCQQTANLARALFAAAALLLAPAAGAACQGTVYLTFDTGNMAQAQVIADILKRSQVKATFFIANEKTARGDYALDDGWTDYWRARVAEGHVFGTHTWSHNYLRKDLADGKTLSASTRGPAFNLEKKAFCSELNRVDERFRALTGRRLDGVWRAPGGRTTQQTILWAASCGYPLHAGWSDAGWLGDELPSETYPNDKLLKRALDNIRAGDVIIMHLGIASRHDPLAPVLAPLIQGLKDKGMCFAPLVPTTP
jgi:peptidoglycan-N-acetylmuramic acid deacetylase